jgi:hypothetical protein
MKGETNKAFLGDGWEDIRLKIPQGKFRLVMLDFFDYTAQVVGDFDTLEEAKDYLEELTENQLDEYTDFVIYNDKGEVVFDYGNFKPFGGGIDEEVNVIPVPVDEDVAIQIDDDTNYVAVAIFLDEQGKFEDLLFENAANLDEAKKYAEELKKKYTDASRIVVLDREGNVLEEM